nr:hypothetical protein [Tanacetum cinerariifolium]
MSPKKEARVALMQACVATTNGIKMNDQLRNSFASLAPPIVASPAKRIQALTGDPDFMTSLARGLALHEACNMATLEGDDILYIARSATTQRLISVDLAVGGRLPAYCTSMGRILLAALDDVSLQEYLDHVDLQPKTSRTLRTPEALLECL